MSNHVDDSCPEGPFETEGEKAYREYWAKQGSNVTTKPAPTTPRVAESLDDLAVGMVVAWETDAGRVGGGTIYGFGQDCLVTGHNGGGDIWDKVKHGPVVILADPPAPPARDWLVPADTMEALREAWGNHDGDMPCPTYEAARALLDAATEVKYEKDADAEDYGGELWSTTATALRAALGEDA